MARRRAKVVKRPPAIRDLLDIANYIARDSLLAADRFLAMSEATFAQLAQMPGLGTGWEDDDPELADVRYCPVSKFPRYLIFYRPAGHGIEVLRILHGARDIEKAFHPEDSD